MKFWLMLSMSSLAWADQFHYNNVLMGDRASGLGGAFGAVADDASGVHYNPAGLGFALSNELSGSANAIYGKTTTYKDAAFGDDFVEKSSGTLAPFFGALGKLDHIYPGLVFAFGYMTLDSELKDQDDLIKSGLTRFHRTANVRASTNKFSLAVGKRFGGTFAAGFGLSYLWVDELAQVYQDFKTTATGYEVGDDGKRTTNADGNQTVRDNCCLRYLAQNVRERLQMNAIEPTLGFQFAATSQLALGLTLKQGFILSDNYESGFERSIYYTDGNGNMIDHIGTDTIDELGASQRASAHYPVDSTKTKSAIGALPLETRLGAAWFASTSTLVTSDVTYHGATKGKVEQYERDAVINYALGMEHYITPSYPIRFGVFTNNDARPTPSSSKTDQRDHIDYTGASLYVAFVQPNSQIAVGGIVQQGKGKAQKVAGATDIQEVEAFAWTTGFSVSHNF